MFVFIADWVPQPERKVWHPVVWQQPPPPIPPEQTGEVITIFLIQHLIA